LRERTPTIRVDVGGHELRLASAGTGPPDFLCLHGLVDRLEIWDRLADPLAERGQVARIDQRGHGESDAPPGPYRREDLARDVASVIGVLGGHRTVLVADRLLDAQLEVVPECGHWVHVEDPDAVLAPLDRWLPRLSR
jgi:pimeloyl-ACP methyl ester carboxylesterase